LRAESTVGRLIHFVSKYLLLNPNRLLPFEGLQTVISNQNSSTHLPRGKRLHYTATASATIRVAKCSLCFGGAHWHRAVIMSWGYYPSRYPHDIYLNISLISVSETIISFSFIIYLLTQYLPMTTYGVIICRVRGLEVFSSARWKYRMANIDFVSSFRTAIRW